MALTVFIADCLHVQAFEKFSFVHEALEGESPTITDCLKILSLVDINVDGGKTCVFFGFGGCWLSH